MGGSSVNLSVYCKSFMSGSYAEFDSASLLQLGGIPLSALVVPVIFIVALVSILAYWKKVHIPKQAAKKLAVIKKFIENGKMKGRVENYTVEENTSLWYMGTIFASHTKKGGAKKPLQPIIEQLVEKEFLHYFYENGEKTLIGMCQELADHNYNEFLSILSNEILRKIEEKQFELKLEDNEFRIRCWRLSSLLVKKPELGGDLKVLIESASIPIQELQTKTHLREEFVPYISQIMVRAWEYAPWIAKWLPEVFLPFDLEYKMYFLKELDQISHGILSYKKMPLIDAIASTIKLKTIIEKPEEEWEVFFADLIKVGYKQKIAPLDTSGIEEIEYKKRFELAAVLIKSHSQMQIDEIIGKLLSIEESERESFFDYDVPEAISDYCSDKGWESYPLMKYNRRAILDVIRKSQQKSTSSDRRSRKRSRHYEVNYDGSQTPKQKSGRSVSLIPFIQGIPDDIIAKIRENPGSQSILRYTMGNILVDRLRTGNYEIASVIKLYGPPYDKIVDIVGANINATILKGGNDRNLHECLLTLQSVLLESGASKKKIKEISDWVKLWSTINEKTRDVKEDYEYPSKLLDVIEDTKGELDPLLIAQQALSLIGPDLEKCINIFHNIDARSFNQKMYETRVEESRKRLEAVKHAYYKLQILSKNQRLNVTDEVRKSFIQISEEILGFVTKCRREDFLERMQHFPLDFGAVLDPGALVKTTVERAAFVYLPPAYHTFPLPALKVLDEFLKTPESIPFSGNKAHGIIVSPDYWVFAIAVGMTLQPVVAYAEQTYSDFFVPEYLKTAALAFKKGEVPIEKLLRRVIPDFENLDSSNLLVTLFKQLTDQHFFQGVITREFIIEALKFGGWDVSLADKIIEEKDYCIFCSFALPEDAKECPNCKRAVQKFDLSTITPEDMEIDLDALGVGGSSGGGPLTSAGKEDM